MKKKKIKYGKKDVLPEGKFDPKKSKILISFMIDGDLLELIKKAARSKNPKDYGKVINKKLREIFHYDAVVKRAADDWLKSMAFSAYHVNYPAGK